MQPEFETSSILSSNFFPSRRMPSIPWPKRTPFDRQPSASSDETVIGTVPQHAKPHAEDTLNGTPAPAPDHGLSRRGTKRGFIKNLLSRTPSSAGSAADPSVTRTKSAPRPRRLASSAEKRKRQSSASTNGRGGAKTVAAGGAPSPPLSKGTTTTPVSALISFNIRSCSAPVPRQYVPSITVTLHPPHLPRLPLSTPFP
ncbi:hypothetical protein IMZ48_17220 [Candidatus Bathyarchaeota archaeon]|nr:hypothetical protein [Candidatus Bathyarchaeota archaeon]